MSSVLRFNKKVLCLLTDIQPTKAVTSYTAKLMLAKVTSLFANGSTLTKHILVSKSASCLFIVSYMKYITLRRG